MSEFPDQDASAWDEQAVMDLLLDLHLPHERQGPGSADVTMLAWDLAGLDRATPYRVLDIGSGTGAATLTIASETASNVAAVDLLTPFVAELSRRAMQRGVDGRVTALQASMDDLPFADGDFDVVWAEGSAYNIGFEAAIRAWRRLLRPGGMLVASEITWLTAARPPALEDHWNTEYPEIDLASAKFGVLERHGFSPTGYFVLPEGCWREGYYEPILQDLDSLLERHPGALAEHVVLAEREEAALYDAYSAHFGYGMYIARRVA